MDSAQIHLFQAGDRVRHAGFGDGSVEYDKGVTVLVRFDHGIEECEKAVLVKKTSPLQALEKGAWGNPSWAVARALAECIHSINDAWGVFARSRIALLPHQLWVCRRVIETWPTRWLVADDVGLGKTIEAGLILWPLIAKGRVRRLLIICPAHLVSQWQYRLRTMFDIRLVQYVTAADTEKSDFWDTHQQVVVSLQTIRDERAKRYERLFESEPWDLLIVDEAHHLNADEHSGPTLGYKLVQRLVEERRVTSLVFFTGTPHRGKNFGFLSLLKLLKPESFDPRGSLATQLPLLSDVMIRNNKQSVTDLKGNALFKQPEVTSETYSYTPEEARFYAMLTEFIISGRAYASRLSSNEGRAVMLVLIAMQKLASSSIAAIRRALQRRLARIVDRRSKLSDLTHKRNALAGFLDEYDKVSEMGDDDSLQKLDEQIAEVSAELMLMHDEEPRLKELLQAANEVVSDTKIERIVEIIKSRFAGQKVLLFTEYKATQSLLMSALMQKFGNGCVTFINGEHRAEGVVDDTGKSRNLTEDRESAAEKLNTGVVRFLVSTEAGGEGIDLQERCSVLIHVDLPWNPMRLHQRVGRLNRYGQKNQVRVVSLRNPDTVESRIWDKLNEKLNNIMLAFGHAMDEPEDLLQLVLGMTSPNVFREVFAEGSLQERDSLARWFDSKTASLGGKDVVETVKSIVGHCAKFDFQQVSRLIPQVDLPALRPFFMTLLTLNNRRVRESEDGISFKTPEPWLTEGVRRSYDNVVFDRTLTGKDAAQRVLGVGHKAVDEALRQARAAEDLVAVFSVEGFERPIFVFRIWDRVTGLDTTVRAVVVGVETVPNTGEVVTILRDWELLLRLNELMKPRALDHRPDSAETSIHLKNAAEAVRAELASFGLPFSIPEVELYAAFWPQ
jgi:ERCC4-related helicase